MNQIHEEHLGDTGTEEQARGIVKIMQGMGWEVEYGPDTLWKFENDNDEYDFNLAPGEGYWVWIDGDGTVSYCP